MIYILWIMSELNPVNSFSFCSLVVAEADMAYKMHSRSIKRSSIISFFFANKIGYFADVKYDVYCVI